jgi:hypothetical protein
MNLNQIVELLSSGGWGLSAILMVVVYRQYRDNQFKDEKIFGLLDKQSVLLQAIDKLADKLDDEKG